LNCAGSVISKREKDERRHSAPLPVAIAATAKTSVLQRAIVPRQEGEEKMDTHGGGAPPPDNTLQLIILVDPEQPALPPSGTARGSLANWGSGTAGPVVKAAYGNYHQETDSGGSGLSQEGMLTTARNNNIQMQRKLRGEHTAIGSGPAADTFTCGDIFLNGDNRNNKAVLVEDNRVQLVSTNSFRLEDWMRISCNNSHQLLPRQKDRERWDGGRQLIFLCDHNIPAILPSKDGK
jgi:hypothetical protein